MYHSCMQDTKYDDMVGIMCIQWTEDQESMYAVGGEIVDAYMGLRENRTHPWVLPTFPPISSSVGIDGKGEMMINIWEKDQY